jgi:ketosteroid isomerase-like protein
MKSTRVLLSAIVLMLVCGFSIAQSPAPEERKQDHEALRSLLAKSAEALTTRNLDLLTPLTAPGFTVITVDNQKLVGLDAFKKYYSGLFEGPTAKLSKLEAKPAADDLTRFLGENVGVANGASEDVYHFKDGDVRVMKSRWSAVMQKDGDTWKLANVHFSANLADNPVLTGVKAYAMKLAAGGAAGGLLVGILLMLLLRRKAS